MPRIAAQGFGVMWMVSGWGAMVPLNLCKKIQPLDYPVQLSWPAARLGSAKKKIFKSVLKVFGDDVKIDLKNLNLVKSISKAKKTWGMI